MAEIKIKFIFFQVFKGGTKDECSRGIRKL
jgi:hypothetical protein